MSYNHTTEGHQGLDGFLRALKLQGVQYTLKSEQGGRRVHFSAVPAGKRKPRSFVAEEYLALISDDWSDGTDYVDFTIYEEGERPDLEAKTQDAHMEALHRAECYS